MKKNLEILDFEDKKTQGGKRYTRFKTNEGWMSLFNSEEIEKLKKFEGKTACVGVVQSGDFLNIKKCYGESQFLEEHEKDYNETDEKPEVVRPGESGVQPEKKGWKPTTTMYVSYAKDVFIKLIEGKDYAVDELKNTMKASLELIKQAKEAFE